MSAKNTLLDFPPYLDCPKPDSDEVRYSKMSDTRLCSELNKIWQKQKELKEKEKLFNIFVLYVINKITGLMKNLIQQNYIFKENYGAK